MMARKVIFKIFIRIDNSGYIFVLMGSVNAIEEEKVLLPYFCNSSRISSFPVVSQFFLPLDFSR